MGSEQPVTSDPVRFKAGEPGYGPEFCDTDVCGADMPVKRREWGFRICFGCQSLIEQKAAMRRQ